MVVSLKKFRKFVSMQITYQHFFFTELSLKAPLHNDILNLSSYGEKEPFHPMIGL